MGNILTVYFVMEHLTTDSKTELADVSQPLDCSEIVYRIISTDYWVKKKTGRITRHAFLRRPTDTKKEKWRETLAMPGRRKSGIAVKPCAIGGGVDEKKISAPKKGEGAEKSAPNFSKPHSIYTTTARQLQRGIT